ncbi:MAG: hypothetical protein JWO40_233 [Candidatus Doudnabacteria bacterium]|nr:hypothetical protein [Candidatus Doudnabacteria bacterium]
MSQSEILKRATNPKQYDSQDLEWSLEASMESPRTQFLWEYLRGYVTEWKGKRVLDIGSGDGWLLAQALMAGASCAIGVEPSTHNVALSKKLNPDIEVFETSFEEYQIIKNSADIALGILSFSHIKNLQEVLVKIEDILSVNGELFLIVPDFIHFKKPRRKYKIEFEDLSAEEYVVSITRPSGTIADIVRTNSIYVEAAKKAGLDLVEVIPMLPTEKFMTQYSDLREFEGHPIMQLLRFRKSV